MTRPNVKLSRHRIANNLKFGFNQWLTNKLLNNGDTYTKTNVVSEKAKFRYEQVS